MADRKYRAIVSSDWSECLSPNGPFDPIAFNYPGLADELTTIFRLYTGNRIRLGEATTRIKSLIPHLLSEEQMDAYLDASYRTYPGVSDLIEWCLGQEILFMINTTGTQAYFQRVLAKKMLPAVPVVAANPMIRFDTGDATAPYLEEVLETEDKPRNTEAVMRRFGLTSIRPVVMGDSGGDGPHFEWAAQKGGFLIGSMTKASLQDYCQSRKVVISSFFGPRYEAGVPRDPAAEMSVNFMDLTAVITKALDLD
jgi:hypothetical protein